MQSANLVIQQKDFQFNKAAIAFIADKIDPLFSDKASAMVKAFRAYMKESSFGQIHSVDYDLVCQMNQGVIGRLTENAVMSVNGQEVVGVMNSKVNMGLFDPKGYVEKPADELLAIIDGAFDFHNKEVAPDGSHKSKFTSLRPLLREALSKSIKAFVNEGEKPFSWIILLDDTPGYYYGIVITLNNDVPATKQV